MLPETLCNVSISQALRSGVLRTLLLDVASTEHPLPLRKKCMYAVSAMIRHFPLAQLHFAQYGGFQILFHLFRQVKSS